LIQLQPTTQPTKATALLRSSQRRSGTGPVCCPSLVAVCLRVQIQRRLNFGVTQDALNGLRFDFRLVTTSCSGCDASRGVRTFVRPRFLDWHSGLFGGRSQVVGDKTGGVQRLPALLSKLTERQNRPASRATSVDATCEDVGSELGASGRSHPMRLVWSHRRFPWPSVLKILIRPSPTICRSI
jgi:hypothetical protein